MLKSNTAFVIGAGASFDFDFPLGDGLRDHIVNLLAVDDPSTSINFSDPGLSEIVRGLAIKELGPSGWDRRMDTYRAAASVIRDGLPFARSIDSFLEGLRGEPNVEFLGKLAIGAAILRAEAACALSPNPGVPLTVQKRAERLKQLTGSWHAQLGQMLYEGHTRDTIDDVFERASFVIFNYDRCVEEFLAISLMRRFAIDRFRALAVVSKCRIVHPYGQVGGFFPDEDGYVAFGRASEREILSVASGIKTYTESMEQHIGDAVKDSIANARTIVFLGYGWLPQNMALLQATDRLTSASKIFATTFAIDPGEIGVIADRIDYVLNRGRYSRDRDNLPMPSADFINVFGDCKALLQNCWLRISND